ncbi:16S rRNA (cytosine(967)-C(5))-methyltransferase RsmB [Echinimonas agarilytica]|uniref:16S rRNA (cytosine(967)-C(5))-methyltransferase n=1 Tax=Echinimonas agarilytica TaxID=1215918 RepID=A0AA41W3L3_9GAMM|nr:16S rRNA (cytosine(967)-C(5))-methyltransferase RsmB [Echinimonas agarilytica]MCM2678065.1 16S rRNA (cytosine(967)-C(5))-methyltransferase RsmB [Echinimonas agarilytica]
MNSRACAAQAVYEVLEHGRSLSDSLVSAQQACTNPKDKGLIAELSYGVLRWLPQLDIRAQDKLSKPFKGKNRVIHHLLLVGMYQLIHTRIPGHAAVSETVEACRQLGAKGLAGVTNGVLRSVQRDLAAEVNTSTDQQWPSDTLQYAHPKWFIEALKADYPNHWRLILEANTERAPMWLRVNRRKISRDEFLDALEAEQIDANPTIVGEDAVLLAEPCDVRKLPGFDDGWFAVQDLAAQQAASFLPVQENLKTLDVCAAPGGKTCHWQERADNALNMLAIDIEPKRLARVTENLTRLELKADIKVADAASQDWWDGELFDAILLDAPCSATGVIRRHPDIKWLRTKSDIQELSQLQSKILQNVWTMLKPNGVLLYATCSVLKAENQTQIVDFLAARTDAELVPIHEYETPQQPGWQILPGTDGMDGFYYARLQKRA